MHSIWFIYIIIVVILWAVTSLIYKAGIHKEPENHTDIKYSISVGVVFFVISLIYLIIRDVIIVGMEYSVFSLGCWNFP